MRRVKSILKFLSVLLLIWYYGTTHFFMHTHEVNGVMIMHSHIGDKQHDHTTLEYQLFKSLGESLVIFCDVPFFLIVLAAITILQNYGLVRRMQQPLLLHFSLRAPPAFC